MATGTTTSTTKTEVDPLVQPFYKYGLTEAQKQYQGGGPQYYQGQTYVGPSQATQTGLQALQARAGAGSPLTAAAQNQLYGTIQGDYLGGNPFFQGAFQPAAQAATDAFNTAIGNVTSQASQAGRYGSGAMTNLQGAAAGQLAQKLTGTAGQLAYQNYADERARQQQATFGAPALAEADYADINKMLAAGQLGEGYQNQALQADINRFNFQQNAPTVNLQNYLSNIGMIPRGTQTTSQNPYFTNQTANRLGTGLLGVELLNKASPYLQSGYNWLSNWGSSPVNMGTATGSDLSLFYGS
jgi:hypothetical protein